MEIMVDPELFKVGGDAWHREWNERRNAAVAALIAAVRIGLPDDSPRSAVDDESVKTVFVRMKHQRPYEALATDDARLYEAVIHAMNEAREDERKRFSRAVGRGLKALLGEDFTSVMYDIAQEYEINIGRD